MTHDDCGIDAANQAGTGAKRVLRAGFRASGRAALLLACCLVGVVPAFAAPLELVSSTTIPAFIDTNAESQNPNAISADGRFAAFYSEATNLVSGDANRVGDFFVYDHATGTVTRESVGAGGTEGNAGAYNVGAGLSADGRYLAFASFASNLAPGASGIQVYLRDRSAGTTTLVSKSSAGVAGNLLSYFPKLTPDGRYVVFTSLSDNLVAGDTNGRYDVFRHDTLTGETLRVSLGQGGIEGNGDSAIGFLSDNGQLVAFESFATNLVPGDSNGVRDVFVRDLVTGMTTRVSVGAGGAQLAVQSFMQWDRSISSGGRYVVFDTVAAAEAGDTNGAQDVYRHDRVTGATLRASVGTGGVQGNSSAFIGVLSGDGQKVLFSSNASNMVAGDTNGVTDVFLRDVVAGTTERRFAADGVSTFGQSTAYTMTPDAEVIAFRGDGDGLVAADRNGFSDVFRHQRLAASSARMSTAAPGPPLAAANNHSNRPGQPYSPSVSNDGRFVVFESRATNLVAGDTNNVNDVFLRDREAGTITRISVRTDGAQALCESDAATLTPDARYVVFTSCDPLAPPAVGNRYEVYRLDRMTGTTTLVAVTPAGGRSNSLSYLPHMSHDGNVIAFHSCATDLVAGDTNGRCDVFVRDMAAGVTVMASRTATGNGGNAGALYPRVSGDGRFVAFESTSTDLVAGDTNNANDAFLFDRQSLAVERVSLGVGAVQLNGSSAPLGVSGDGNRVVFSSFATNVGAGTTLGGHLYVRDRAAGMTLLATRRPDGTVLNSSGFGASISTDGNRVGFMASASNSLEVGGNNFLVKAFMVDLQGGGVLRLLSVPVIGTSPDSQSVGTAQLSANGRHAAFASQAGNLVANDANYRFTDVFLARDIGAAALPETVFGNGFE